MNLREEIKDQANNLLDAEPAPAVRVRILADILNTPPDNPDLIQAQTDLSNSDSVLQLAREQHRDGGWGRFHSVDSKSKGDSMTTEDAVDRMLALGLAQNHPIYEKTTAYLADLLNNKLEFPDPPDSNPRWSFGIKLFSAAALARLDPNHPALEKESRLWADITDKTFYLGMYNPRAEKESHSELTGLENDLGYLAMPNKYLLGLLAACQSSLQPDVEPALVKWVWFREEGIGFFGQALHRHPALNKPSALESWFQSQELLSLFPSWVDEAGEIVRWLLEQREPNRLWDFGPRDKKAHTFPLSENWQNRSNRKIDWTVRTLTLLSRYYN